MDYKIKEVDTETWILLFLYKERIVEEALMIWQ